MSNPFSKAKVSDSETDLSGIYKTYIQNLPRDDVKLLRIPKQLKEAVTSVSEAEGVSATTYILTLIAESPKVKAYVEKERG